MNEKEFFLPAGILRDIYAPVTPALLRHERIGYAGSVHAQFTQSPIIPSQAAAVSSSSSQYTTPVAYTNSQHRQHDSSPAAAASSSLTSQRITFTRSSSKHVAASSAAESPQPSPPSQIHVISKSERYATLLTTIGEWAYENGVVPSQTRTGINAAIGQSWMGVAEKMMKSAIKDIFNSMDVAQVAKSCSDTYANLMLMIKVSPHSIFMLIKIVS